jgi:hypothetical protein
LFSARYDRAEQATDPDLPLPQDFSSCAAL